MTSAAVIGAGVSLYAKKTQGDFEAKVASNNAQLATQQANDALRLGADEAATIKAQGRQASASAVAAMGATGIESTTGSAANVIASSAVNAALDAEQAKANAARRAWGFQNEAQDSLAKKKMIKRATILGGIGQGVGSAASIGASSYGLYKQETEV